MSNFLGFFSLYVRLRVRSHNLAVKCSETKAMISKEVNMLLFNFHCLFRFIAKSLGRVWELGVNAGLALYKNRVQSACIT